jgi:hypothetical protein
MEVHAHTHTARKKWTHYFWEFLMLFLAVFCGFLAENQREHMIEHQREKKHIASFIEDLHTDISRAEEYIQYRENKIKKADSLIHLLISGEYVNAGSETYFLFIQSMRGWAFISANGTMQQLKNAGGLRLIRKRNVVDSIMAYDALVTGQQFQDGVEQEFLEKLRDLTGDIFDAGVFLETYNPATNQAIRPVGNPKLISNDPAMINKLATRVIYARGTAKFSLMDAVRLKVSAARLIKYLTEEYHLK